MKRPGSGASCFYWCVLAVLSQASVKRIVLIEIISRDKQAVILSGLQDNNIASVLVQKLVSPAPTCGLGLPHKDAAAFPSYIVARVAVAIVLHESPGPSNPFAPIGVRVAILGPVPAFTIVATCQMPKALFAVTPLWMMPHVYGQTHECGAIFKPVRFENVIELSLVSFPLSQVCTRLGFWYPTAVEVHRSLQSADQMKTLNFLAVGSVLFMRPYPERAMILFTIATFALLSFRSAPE